MRSYLNRFEVRVTFGYAIVAILWIIFSDKLVAFLFGSSTQLLTTFSIFKGIAFVVVTAGGLFVVLYFELHKRRTLERALEQDIDERKIAEIALGKAQGVLEQKVIERTAELKSAKDRAEAILNNSFDGIVLVNSDLKVEQTNAAFNRFLACQDDEYFGKSVLDLIDEEDRGRVQLLINPHTVTHSNKSFEAQLRRQDGTVFQAEFGIGAVQNNGLVITIRDISERKARERQLRFYASLQENVNDAVIATDLEHRIQTWNPAAERMYGWRADDVIGKRSEEVLQTQFLSSESYDHAMRKLQEQGYWTDEAIQRHKDGKTVYILGSLVCFKDENGKRLGIVTVNHDITERKKAEQALQLALEKERELSELKSRFVSMASHEFRTPLATILAAAETLSAYRQKMTDEQITMRFTKIKEQVARLRDVMDDVLLLARMQAQRVEFQPDDIDLVALCKSVVDDFQSRSDVHHQFSFTQEGTMRNVRLDKKLMRQILDNLISNAIKYSAPDKPIAVHLDYAWNAVLLKISDQGIGIPDEDRKHLFEAFHRANNVGSISGTGLGLVIAKEAVELQGGTIAVESQIDVGTTFTIRIPLATLQAEKHEQPAVLTNATATATNSSSEPALQ
ncbi:MAG: PAS domain S-box protein [Anaerolineae bacterium]|nr:PAS domain S-box protein [Anaerolineae bacterium]